VKRREFIELAGAATMLDVDGLEENDDGGALRVDPAEGSYRTALDRCPTTPGPGDRSPSITVSVDPNERYLAEPALHGDAEVHAGVFAERAMIAIGIGGPAPWGLPDRLDRQFESRGRIAGNPLYGRWDGRRYRAAVADDAAVYLGLGPDPDAVGRWLSASVRGSSLPPEIELAVDLLGPISVASVEPVAPPEGATADTGGSRPVVVGRGIALGEGTASVRCVEVYESRGAALEGPRDRRWSWASSLESLSAPSTRRDGRAWVADASADPKPLLDGSLAGR